MSSLDTIPVCTGVATGNVEPLLHEIRHALKRLAEGKEGTVIDLKRMPLARAKKSKLRQHLVPVKFAPKSTRSVQH